MIQERKLIWGWAMYDWSNSAFSTTVMAGFFPIFFKQYWSVGVDVNQSTAMLGFGNSFASLLVALFAPILGAIADQGSLKKKFMIFFSYLGVLMTVGLYLVGEGDWMLALFLYVMGVIGFSGANIFYDSLLPSVAKKSNVDSVSSLGFAMGYLGGGILFFMNVMMTLHPTIFGIVDAGEAVKWSFVSVGFWWGAFTLITVAWVPEPHNEISKRGVSLIIAGFHQLYRTFQEIRNLKSVVLFLLAYWFYIDGVDTIVKMSVDYGITLGFESNDLIIALLIVQFVGFPAALIFGRLGELWGVRPSIFLAIGVYVAITIWGTMMREKYEFYILAIAIGAVQGGIQALSRSYYSRIIPKNQAAEYFGFYNMLGKFAAILGPALIGVVGVTMRNFLMPKNPSAEELIKLGQDAARWSIASIILLFLIGATLFYFVDEEKGLSELEHLRNKKSDF